MTTPGLKEAYFNTWSEPLPSLDSLYMITDGKPSQKLVKLPVKHLDQELEKCAFVKCRKVGWFTEKCGHDNVKPYALSCGSWSCPDCQKFNFNKALVRIKKAYTLSLDRYDSPLKFLTQTFSEDVTRETAKRKLARFASKVRYNFGADSFEYMKAPERTKKGRLHFHSLVIMPFVPQKKLQHMWGSIVDIRAVKCKRCHQDGSTCHHYDQASFEGAEELLKYMSDTKKVKAGKLTTTKGFPKLDKTKSRMGICPDCGREHSWAFTKDIRDLSAEFGKHQEVNLDSGYKFNDWITEEHPLYHKDKKCSCWIVNNGKGL
tara:strand:- start:638 stop:1588 length:951 start_codon:yes stop_codon:yes gene_type:complete